MRTQPAKQPSRKRDADVRSSVESIQPRARALSQADPGGQGGSAAEWVKPSALKPWPQNPTKDDPASVRRVAESIKRFGFGAPLVARRANGEVIAGHTRLRAAKQLGLELVPVRYLDISEKDAHVLALADNRLAELTLRNNAELAELLKAMEPSDQLLAGYTGGDVQALLRQAEGEADVIEDDVPEPPKTPVTKPGDVWLLGRHRLTCARGESVTESFDIVVTDPPYGVAVVQKGMVGARFSESVAQKGRYAPIAGDDVATDVRWLLSRASVAIIWGGNYFADQLPPSGGWLVWDKRGDSGIENTFADCELAWSNRTGPARVHRQLWNGMIREGEHQPRQHPTQKPVALMAFCVGMGRGRVFDAYAGAGSTLIACEQLDRQCTAVELSPAYCDVIIQRWQNLSGQKATRG